jgi:uncharacterized protein (TIGR02246 family)
LERGSIGLPNLDGGNSEWRYCKRRANLIELEITLELHSGRIQLQRGMGGLPDWYFRIARIRSVRYAPSMRMLVAAFSALMLAAQHGLCADDEAKVQSAIQSFYKAFDEGFTGPINFAAADWNHINPNGGRTRGRDATVNEIRSVHRSFLKGTTDRIEAMDVRFASPTVAVGTVASIMSAFTMPDGVKHGTERHIRTFVLVKRADVWLIMQDQNTAVVGTAH